jgi:hypothetical protein
MVTKCDVLIRRFEIGNVESMMAPESKCTSVNNAGTPGSAHQIQPDHALKLWKSVADDIT